MESMKFDSAPALDSRPKRDWDLRSENDVFLFFSFDFVKKIEETTDIGLLYKKAWHG